EGITELEKAVKAEPDNPEYRVQLARQREVQTSALLAQADQAMAASDFDIAASLYQRVLKVHPENRRARSALEAIDGDRKHKDLIGEAKALFAKGKTEEAKAKIKVVLADNPNQQSALSLRRQMDDEEIRPASASGMRAAL